MKLVVELLACTVVPLKFTVPLPPAELNRFNCSVPPFRLKMNYLANVGGDLDILETWDDP